MLAGVAEDALDTARRIARLTRDQATSLACE